MGDLRLWRNDKIEQLSLQPVVVFSNGQLRNIAREMPIDLVALSDVEAVRNWQVKWYGSEIVNIVKRYHRSTK